MQNDPFMQSNTAVEITFWSKDLLPAGDAIVKAIYRSIKRQLFDYPYNGSWAFDQLAGE